MAWNLMAELLLLETLAYGAYFGNFMMRVFVWIPFPSLRKSVSDLSDMLSLWCQNSDASKRIEHSDVHNININLGGFAYLLGILLSWQIVLETIQYVKLNAVSHLENKLVWIITQFLAKYVKLWCLLIPLKFYVRMIRGIELKLSYEYVAVI